MGSALNAKCPCGFSSEDLAVGGGMMNFQTYCGAPALCEACADMLVVNYLDDQPACPMCKGAIMFYNAPRLRRKLRRGSPGTPLIFSWTLEKGSFKLPDTEYRCPRCGKVKMRFFDLGRSPEMTHPLLTKTEPPVPEKSTKPRLKTGDQERRMS